MLMRKRPIRGEKYVLSSEGVEVTILEEGADDCVRVILPSGKVAVLAKENLNLPVIDTSYYEKYAHPKT